MRGGNYGKHLRKNLEKEAYRYTLYNEKDDLKLIIDEEEPPENKNLLQNSEQSFESNENDEFSDNKEENEDDKDDNED